MSSRLQSRVLIQRNAWLHRVKSFNAAFPENPQRILIAHHLLLGDTLMLAALLKGLRQRFPNADITLLVPQAFIDLFQKKPWQTDTIAYSMRDANSVKAIIESGPYDLAYAPGDNRYAWLAKAAGAKHVVALEGDRPFYKNWMVDSFIAFPANPMNWADILGEMSGATPDAFQTGEWRAPDFAPFELPNTPYVLLHVAASSVLKHWSAQNWQALIKFLQAHNLTPVFSCGPNEEWVIEDIDPEHTFPRFAGNLSLPQLWHLLSQARFIVAPDTGVAHLGKIVGTPTFCLYGPGSPTLYGKGEFWWHQPFYAIAQDPFPCRNQHRLFKREIDWVQRCGRSLDECAFAKCMEAISVEQLTQTIQENITL